METKTTKAALVRSIKEAEEKAFAAGAKEVAVIFFEIVEPKKIVRSVAVSRFAACYGKGRTGLVNKSGGLVAYLKNGFEDPTATHFTIRF